MKKLPILQSFLVTLLLSFALWSCVREDSPNPTMIQENTKAEQASDRTCTGNCTFRVKITNVSPSGAGWSFVVVTGSSLIFESDNVNMTCDGTDGTSNNSLNTWYNFSVPQCDNLTISVADLQISPSNCTNTSGSITYTVQEVGGPIPPTEESYTLNWTNTTVSRVYGSDSNCNLLVFD